MTEWIVYVGGSDTGHDDDDNAGYSLPCPDSDLKDFAETLEWFLRYYVRGSDRVLPWCAHNAHTGEWRGNADLIRHWQSVSADSRAQAGVVRSRIARWSVVTCGECRSSNGPIALGIASAIACQSCGATIVLGEAPIDYDRDLFESLNLIAENDGNAYRDGRDASTAVDRAFREYQRAQREREREEFQAMRSDLVARLARRWGQS